MTDERLTDNLPIDTLSTSSTSSSSSNIFSNSTSSSSIQSINSDFQEEPIMVNNFMIENELQQEIDRQIDSRRTSEIIIPTRRNSLLPPLAPIRSYLTYVEPVSDNILIIIIILMIQYSYCK